MILLQGYSRLMSFLLDNRKLWFTLNSFLFQQKEKEGDFSNEKNVQPF